MFRVLSFLLVTTFTFGLLGCSGKAQIEAPKVTGSVPQKLNEKDNARSVS